MKKFALTLVASLACAPLALAASEHDDATQTVEDEAQMMMEAFGMSDGGHANGPCSKINATEEQKKVIMDQVFAYKKEAIQLHADIKTARLNYAQSVFSDATDTDQVETASTAIVDGVQKSIQAKLNLKNEVLFKVLTVEQRKPAYLCMEMMHKKHRGHRGARHGK